MPVVLHLQPPVSCLENCGSGHDTWYESVNEVEPGLEQVKSGNNQIEIEKEANKTKTRHFFPGDVSANCRPFSLLLQVHQGSAAQHILFQYKPSCFAGFRSLFQSKSDGLPCGSGPTVACS